MLNRSTFITIVGIVTTVSLYKQNRLLRKFNDELVNALDETVDNRLYFAKIVVDNNIELNEFDKIVLSHYTKRSLKRIQK